MTDSLMLGLTCIIKLKRRPTKNVAIYTVIIMVDVVMPGITGHTSSTPRFKQRGRKATANMLFKNIPDFIAKLSTR